MNQLILVMYHPNRNLLITVESLFEVWARNDFGWVIIGEL